MRPWPLALLLLLLAGCGSVPQDRSSPEPRETTPVDQCSLPVEQRTGGWLCHGEPSPAAQ
jgi:hypothetical protein